jgi:hypothetical protein
MNDGKVTTERLYAWVGKDLNGIEGIVAFPFTDGTPMPLVASEEALARQLKGPAQQAARARKLVVSLVVFERGATLDSTQ